MKRERERDEERERETGILYMVPNTFPYSMKK